METDVFSLIIQIFFHNYLHFLLIMTKKSAPFKGTIYNLNIRFSFDFVSNWNLKLFTVMCYYHSGRDDCSV